jgi:KDO2-lipid IV(A) lauroyltransferase
MQKLIFYIIYPPIWLLSKLPFWFLYRISDLIFLIIYYLVGYRKELVLYNLKTFFPEKSDKELKAVRRKFYSHFVDIFMEMIKTFTITPGELDKHFIVKNNEVLLELEKNNRSAIIIGCHYANWEWTIKVGQGTEFKRYGVYARIRNEVFSDTIQASRERFGLKLLKKNETTLAIGRNKRDNLKSIYGFLSDQSPRLNKAYYWTDFLGKRVPVLIGAEAIVKKYDLALVFINIQKVKRGYYEATFELITDEPQKFKNYEITEKYLEMCENQIRQKPEYYFWTHNRFKHVGKEHLSPAKGN